MLRPARTEVTRKRVLLVVASSHTAELVGERLRRNALVEQVDVVGDVDEAVDYLLRRNAHARRATAEPALVLLDVGLGDDPCDDLRRLKSDPRTQSMPVVILTAPARAADIAANYDQGANACVVKPSHMAELSEVIAEVAAFWLGVNRPPW